MASTLRTRRSGRKGPEIGIAPLVDLVFLLLIFFILSSTMIQEEVLPINRPSAETSISVAAPPLVITVTAAGTVHMGGDRVALTGLREKVQALLAGDTERRALVAVDEEARAGLAVRVMDECRLAGAMEVLLATTHPEGER